MLGLAVYLLALAFLTVATIRAPHLSLVGVLCMFGLDQIGQLSSPFLRSHGALLNIYILGLVGSAVLLKYRNNKFQLGFKYQACKVRVLSVLLYLLAFLSLVWAPPNSLSYWSNQWPYIIASIALPPLLLTKLSDLKEIQRTLVWVGGILLLYLTIVPHWGERSLVIPGSTEKLQLPLALAQLSGYVLITAIVNFNKNHESIIWGVIAVVASLFVAIKTGSRGQLIFALLSVFLVAPIVWRKLSPKRVIQLVAVSLVLLTASAYILVTSHALSDRWQFSEMIGDLGDRFGMAITLLSHWFDSPIAIIFGLGNSAAFSIPELGVYPHIVVLEILGEEGVIGLLLFVTILVFSFLQAKKLHNLSGVSDSTRRAYAGIFGCFTALLSFKQGSLVTSSVLFFFAVMSEKYFYLVRLKLHEKESSEAKADTPKILQGEHKLRAESPAHVEGHDTPL